MAAEWMRRMRWRRRGAWLWPTFAALSFLDALVGTLLPPVGRSQSFVAAALLGVFLNLFGIVALAWPVSLVLRRRRPDLPRIVARDYGGTLVLGGLAAIILVAGLAHRGALAGARRSEAEAVARAQAWIGDRAPAPFRRNARYVDSYAIEAGSLYRECVPDAHFQRTFCVIVRTRVPFASSVRFAGYEPNGVFAAGTR